METANEIDDRGHFGPYGGTYASETLMHALEELTGASEKWRRDPEFMARFDHDLAHYVGRPSPIYHAERLSEFCGGAQILLNLGITEMILLTNSPAPKVVGLNGYGLSIVETRPIPRRGG